MAVHHTKDKGDLGTAKAHADLVAHGFMVLFPATEHAEFDLVAYRAGTFHRVQVKYRSTRNGAVSVNFRSVWADRHGTHMKRSDKGEIDVLCIYCPDADACYYLRPGAHGQSVTLRVTPGRSAQVRGILPADGFRQFPTLDEWTTLSRHATQPPRPRGVVTSGCGPGPATYEVAGPNSFRA